MALNKNYVDEVTPEQIIKIYTEDSMVITVNQAKGILVFAGRYSS